MRATRWVWHGRSAAARVARGALRPASWLFGGVVACRTRLYRHGVLKRIQPPLPTICVGNLTVGGSGKTPIAAWIAAFVARCGVRPGVVLRGAGGAGGVGGDEASVHRRLVPDAVVVEDPDRLRGARVATAQGARVLILDDGFQRLGLARHLDIVLLSAESLEGSRELLPAGPWREPFAALGRADLVVVTRKRATSAAVAAVAARLARVVPGATVASAHLRLSGFRGLRSDLAFPLETMQAARVVAGAGVAAPDLFAQQLGALGAHVRLLAFRDHHAFDRRDVGRLLQAGASCDYVVVTEKDAVKLRALWPAGAPEPLVAQLDVVWELGHTDVERAVTTLTGLEPWSGGSWGPAQQRPDHT